MSYLLDTGIMLRVADRREAQRPTLHAAVRKLIAQGNPLVTATQNMAEFCNVATRPVINMGLGFAPSDALQLLEREIESICSRLAVPLAVYAELKRLIGTYGVVGKQVHDARLVAMMRVWQVGNILTLNDRDFLRYQPEEINIETPSAVLAAS